MAIGLKGWLGFTVAGLFLVLWWGLSSVQELPGPREPVPERAEFLELNRELAKEGWTYQRIFRRDTLVSLLEAGLQDGEVLVLGFPPETPDSTVQKLQLAADRQLADLDLDRPAIPIGLFVLSNELGAFPGTAGALTFLSTSDEIYLHRDGEEPYCIEALPYQGRRDHPDFTKSRSIAASLRFRVSTPRDPRQPSNLFSFCRYFARHGSPGPRILAWLRDGASAFGRETLRPNHYVYQGTHPARGAFGKPGRSWYGGGTRTELCLRGELEMCQALVLDPVVPTAGIQHMNMDLQQLLDGSPVDFLPRYRDIRSEMLRNEGFLFSILEDEFGPDRFGRFWRSDLPVAAAFEAAFDRSLGEWLKEWLGRYVNPPPRTPQVPVQATLFTILGIGLLAGGAVRMGRR